MARRRVYGSLVPQLLSLSAQSCTSAFLTKSFVHSDLHHDCDREPFPMGRRCDLIPRVSAVPDRTVCPLGES